MNEHALPIELVVFDMDGVLVRLDRARRLQILSQLTGRSPQFLHDAIFASDFEPGAEAGAYASGAAYLAELNRRIGGELTRAQWIAARRDAMTVDRQMLGLAQRLARCVPIATLTNNGPLLREALPEILPEASALFGEHFHASFEFGARKPDRAVFRRLARHHAVARERVLFIDDTAEYVDGARQTGMHAVLFGDPATLAAQLTTFGLACRAPQARCRR